MHFLLRVLCLLGLLIGTVMLIVCLTMLQKNKKTKQKKTKLANIMLMVLRVSVDPKYNRVVFWDSDEK